MNTDISHIKGNIKPQDTIIDKMSCIRILASNKKPSEINLKACKKFLKNIDHVVFSVEAAGIESFKTVSRSIENHYLSILNFFNNRSTNAAAESFNAKVKAFRATSRGVRDTTFFLFRLTNIYA
jgi:transposase